MLIDFHMHAFPDLLAGRTMEKLSAIAGIAPATDATVEGTRAKMREWGVDIGVLMHIATRPAQQRKVNDFAAAVQDASAQDFERSGLVPRFYCFGTVHPDAGDVLEEVERIRALGLKGIKLHPDYQGFHVCEERMLPVYEAIDKAGLPVLFHAGFDPVSPQEVHAPPSEMAKLLDTFPHLTVIAAHMGGMRMPEDVKKYLVGKNVYFDLSMSAVYCDKEDYREIILAHGAERILFGSDCPWSNPAAELCFFDSLTLSQEQRALILYQNAKRILCMSL